MNYPVFRNRSLRALAWQSRATRFRCCLHADRLITCRSGCAGASGAKMTCNNLLTSGSVMPVSVFFPQTPLLQHQKPQSQHRQRHMVMPATPATNLVVVQTYFLLATQEAIFNWPTAMACLHHFQQRTVRSGIAQVVLDVRRLIAAPLDHQPQIGSWQIVALRHDADSNEVGLLRSFGALPKTQAFPGAGRQGRRDLLHGLWLGLVGGHPWLSAPATFSAGLRLTDSGPSQTYTATLRNFR